MDVNKFLQLCELKEKGILTQEEFETEKRKLFPAKETNVTVQSDGNSFVNILCASVNSLLASSPLIFFLAIGIKLGNLIPYFICSIAEAGIFWMKAKKRQTYKYKNCLTPMAVFWLTLISGPIGFGISLYQFYQIDDGLAEFK